MNYDIFSILIFVIIFFISLVTYSNEFYPNRQSGNETFFIHDWTEPKKNFTLKKWNCQHPLGKPYSIMTLGLQTDVSQMTPLSKIGRPLRELATFV